jgi:Flp pilus assembly protein TadD
LVLAAGVLSALSGCNVMSGHVANRMGTAYYQQGNYTMARHEFHRAVADDPTNPDYVNNLAAAMKKQGNPQGAEQVYRQALLVDPGHQPAYHGLAALLKEQGRQAEAIDVLDSWVATQPYSPAAHIETAWFKRESRDYAGAEQSLRSALQVHPNHPVAMAHLGQLYQETGRPQQAMAMYQRSLTNQWHQPEVHSRLASLQESSRPRVIPSPTATTRTVYTAPYGAPQTVVLPQPFPPYQSATGAPMFGGPFVPGPVHLGPPIVEGDPAHVPQVSSPGPFIVQPY